QYHIGHEDRAILIRLGLDADARDQRKVEAGGHGLESRLSARQACGSKSTRQVLRLHLVRLERRRRDFLSGRNEQRRLFDRPQRGVDRIEFSLNVFVSSSREGWRRGRDIRWRGRGGGGDGAP